MRVRVSPAAFLSCKYSVPGVEDNKQGGSNLAQVLAISNDTNLATETKPTRKEQDGFNELLEKEKLKSLPYLLSLNFSNNLLSPTVSFNENNSIKSMSSSSIDNIAVKNNEPSAAQTSGDVSAQKNEKAAAAKQDDNTANTKVQAESNKNLIVNNMSKAMVSDIELTPEFYTNAITAKNRIDSLKGIDVELLVDQIKDKMKFLKDNGTAELSVALKPDELGSILMKISANKGLLTINIFGQSQAREALQPYFKELERSLSLANLKVEKILFISDDNGKNSGENSA
jgi:flagellar hook-length control protein FliK